MNPDRFNQKQRMYIAAVESRRAKAVAIECHYCGMLLAPQSATKEHVLPRARGGKDANENIVFACVTCNTTRGKHDYTAFREHMRPVKMARRAGLPIPDVGKFAPPPIASKSGQAETAYVRAKRLKQSGYTQELLRSCMTASQMRDAGHELAIIAAHFEVTDKAVKAMVSVGRANPSRRLQVAEELHLIQLMRQQSSR